MKKSVNFHDFRNAFHIYGRNENFSYSGQKALFDYLESIEEDTGEEIELDIIALCCEYDEEHWEDIASNYSIDLSECDDDDEREDAVLEYLRYNTSYIGASESGLHVYASF